MIFFEIKDPLFNPQKIISLSILETGKLKVVQPSTSSIVTY